MKLVPRFISEMIVPSIGGQLRVWGRTISSAFFGRPLFHKTVLNYELARQLYRNDGDDTNLGAGFVRPIVDLTVEYVGLPAATSDNGERDAWLNKCITDYWGPQLQQVFRDCIRDSKTIVRFRQPSTENPLFTETDRVHGKLESLPPEFVDIVFDPSDPDLIEKATIRHFIEMDERTEPELRKGVAPRNKEHEILETIYPNRIIFWDKTDNKYLRSWETRNRYGFVPVWPVWNEYSADLGGGQSDLEPVLPFIRAFHDVLLQTLTAHRYHSTPKLKLNLQEVNAFLRNNFPDVLDDSGQIKPGAKVTWSGNEILFFSKEEDGSFLEAQSVLGDSKTLLDFLIDCICIAAEVPRWALLKESKVTDKDASVLPFEKKIERKRHAFGEPVVMLLKMAMVANGFKPETPRITWPTIRVETLIGKAQALQQIIMGLDVATAHQWIADETAIQILGSLFAEINSPEVEARLAANNMVPAVPAEAPASDTQAQHPPSGSSNGKPSKPAAQKAIATTSPSRS
jgi:hypothetical protein